MDSFTYLGSVIDSQGGTDADVKTRINKARIAFRLLKNFWASRDLSVNTKIGLFNTNAKAVLLHVYIWSRNMENHHHDNQKDPDLHQRLSKTNPPHTLAWQDQ